MHKIDGAHHQYVNNYFAKFEKKERKLLELHITQTRLPPSILDGKISKFNTPQK